jgi:hypothetical protein
MTGARRPWLSLILKGSEWTRDNSYPMGVLPAFAPEPEASARMTPD